MQKPSFEWDAEKDEANREKHGVGFGRAQYAFADPRRVIVRDKQHSQDEARYFCFGEVDGGILTVRFTMRGRTIRIIGAGYWRKGKTLYEQENQIHR
ncbi:MAG TPA: BrnT family toxin [Thiomonas arsenitoxydans]|jgi:uncharacterized DUF497 family protein|uniref:BrnT family toxin n=1 Tax=Thiomonas intermedia (strain K12) TaxID=75379 RepID=D5X5X4_THIK1|nr:BrnT family toxin [Thiomonas sp.]OZB69543.1 MAG: hypothetical protein B7X36_14035 [Thiomonas sp. 14-64-326]HOI65124.1 BrnT family toxin [Thiomonas arsenitoxydans]